MSMRSEHCQCAGCHCDWAPQRLPETSGARSAPRLFELDAPAIGHCIALVLLLAVLIMPVALAAALLMAAAATPATLAAAAAELWPRSTGNVEARLAPRNKLAAKC
jgi:hypothetical protein